MNHLKSLLTLVALLGVFLSGCAPSVPAPAAPTAPAKPAAPAAPKKDEPTPEAAKKPAPPAPIGPVEYVGIAPNFVNNASFETWADDGAVGAWNLAEGLDDKWVPVKGTKIEAAPQGGLSAIEFPVPGENQIIVLAQTILPGKIVPKSRLLVSAKVKTVEVGSLQMVLTYRAGGKEESRRLVAQAGGIWQLMTTQFWVPENADPASFRVQFIVYTGSKDPVQLDDVRIQHMAPKGSPAARVVPSPKPAPQSAPAATAPAATAPAAVAPAPAAKPAAPAPAPAEAKAEKSEKVKEPAKKADSKNAPKSEDKKN